MNKRLHRAIGFSLLVCISIGVLSFFCFDFKQLLCKIESDGHLADQSQLVSVKISNAELALNGNKSEFRYHGQLYDIKSQVKAGDSSIVIMWHDTDEEEVQQSIVALFEPNSTAVSNGKPVFLSIYHTFYPDGKIMPVCWQPSGILWPDVRKQIVSQSSASFYLSTTTDVVSPPPDAFA